MTTEYGHAEMWFTVRHKNHVPYPSHDFEALVGFDSVSAGLIASGFEHQVMLPAKKAPISIIVTDFCPSESSPEAWTSMIFKPTDSSPRQVVFAFSRLEDAVAFRLMLPAA